MFDTFDGVDLLFNGIGHIGIHHFRCGTEKGCGDGDKGKIDLGKEIDAKALVSEDSKKDKG